MLRYADTAYGSGSPFMSFCASASYREMRERMFIAADFRDMRLLAR